MTTGKGRLRQAIKRGIDRGCGILVAPCGWMCRLEARSGGEALFSFWAQGFALVPGTPGVFLRRAFYRRTLEQCTGSFYVGFGAVFSHRESVVEDAVYIGPYAIVGSSKLRRRCLIGSRAGIISGAAIHALDEEGRRTATDRRHLRQVEIGEDAWIGEAALVMADVGAAATVAAGAVVSSCVMPGILVAGNPARAVRYLLNRTPEAEESSRAAM